jgi:hypothetical protein
MDTSLPKKRPINALTVSMKKEICQYKQARAIQAHFLTEWGFKIGKSTIGDVWRAKGEWLKKEELDKSCRVRIPKHQDVEDALWLWFGQARASGLAISDRFFII